MKRIVVAGASDVGQARENNEDAYLVGDSVFAVADGMGGHLAGEVASSTALEPISNLDGRVFRDAAEAVMALRDAVVSANQTVVEMAENEPSYRGMGTTLTAALVEGRRLHVAHVGDSRAYLLRDRHFSQLTDDHTLVQHLVDEGRITAEEAEQHPQRSVVTRAIGVSPEVEVDSMSLDLEPGDQLLLCSDGLTGPVADEQIATLLLTDDDVEATVDGLIAEANQAGGPDNITAILLRYDPDSAEASSAPSAEELDDGRPRPMVISTRQDRDSGDWVGRLGSYGEFHKAPTVQRSRSDERRRVGAVVVKSIGFVVGVVLLLGLLYAGARFIASQQYYVGVDAGEVVIYQGVDASLGPLELSEIVERTRIDIEDVEPWYRPQLERGAPAVDFRDARQIVADIPLRATEDEDGDAAADTGDDGATGEDGTP